MTSSRKFLFKVLMAFFGILFVAVLATSEHLPDSVMLKTKIGNGDSVMIEKEKERGIDLETFEDDSPKMLIGDGMPLLASGNVISQFKMDIFIDQLHDISWALKLSLPEYQDELIFNRLPSFGRSYPQKNYSEYFTKMEIPLAEYSLLDFNFEEIMEASVAERRSLHAYIENCLKQLYSACLNADNYPAYSTELKNP